jgi:hypothetical protein
MSLRFLAEGEEPQRDPELREKLLDVCHNANVNAVIQAFMECLLISIIAATANPAEAQTAVDETARVMRRDVQQSWKEFHAMQRRRAQ